MKRKNYQKPRFLEPCPRCGGTVCLQACHDAGGTNYYRVLCYCQYSNAWNASPDAAANDWNAYASVDTNLPY